MSNSESRTLQNIPTKNSPHDDLEIPTANRLAMFTVERDEFCATCFVASTNSNLIQPVANVGARITLQSPQEIGAANGIGPLRVRTGVTVFIVHAAEVRSRSHSPEVADVGSFATTRCAEVGIDRLTMVVH